MAGRPALVPEICGNQAFSPWPQAAVAAGPRNMVEQSEGSQCLASKVTGHEWLGE